MLDHIKAHQAEINKRVRSVYGPSHIQYVEKGEEVDLIKGKSVPIGTVSNGYKKVAEGKWQKVSKYSMTKKEHDFQATRTKETNSAYKDSDSYQEHINAQKDLDDTEYTDDEVMKKPKAADARKKHSVSVTKDNSMGGEAPGEYHYHARSQFEAEGMHMRKYGSKDASKVTSDSHNTEYETKLKKGEDIDEAGEELEKGHKSMPIGTISHGYKKVAEGKWKKVIGSYSTKQEYIDLANKYIAMGKAHEKDYMRKLYEKDGKKALREAAKADDNDYDDDHVDRHAEEKKKKEDDEKKEKAARAASPEENLESLKAALKKRFKDSESEEHHDNVESSLKAYFKSLGIPTAMIDKEPFMEDEMFGGGEHNSVAQTIKHVKNMAPW